MNEGDSERKREREDRKRKTEGIVIWGWNNWIWKTSLWQHWFLVHLSSLPLFFFSLSLANFFPNFPLFLSLSLFISFFWRSSLQGWRVNVIDDSLLPETFFGQLVFLLSLKFLHPCSSMKFILLPSSLFFLLLSPPVNNTIEVMIDTYQLEWWNVEL